eukprot:gene9262-6513_t
MSGPPPPRIFVAKRSQFVGDDSRMLVRHGERNIAVVYHSGDFYAMDNACYHHGGPLLMGDIEDLGGHPCLVCPWHRYPISLRTGEGLYMGLDFPAGQQPVKRIKSKGQMQRVHQVEVCGEDVFVVVNTHPMLLESDTYATMERANRETAMSAPVQMTTGAMRRSGEHLHSHSPRPDRAAGAGTVGLPAPSTQLGGSSGLLTPSEPPRPDSRAGVNPLLSNSSPYATAAGIAYFKDLSIAVRRVSDVCDRTREISFVLRSGSVRRNFELGETIELLLPNNREQHLHLIVTGEDSAGYTSLVRHQPQLDRHGKAKKLDASVPQEWIYEFSLYAVMPVRSVSGRFTLADHMQQLRELGGRVLWLSAGMGISSAYAAMQVFFGPSIALEDVRLRFCEDTLMVLHLHVERQKTAIPKLETLLEWARRCAPQPSNDVNGVKRRRRHHSRSDSNAEGPVPLYSPVPQQATYIFHCFLTKEQEPRTLFPSPLPPVGGGEHGVALPCFVYGRRPTSLDLRLAVETYFGREPFLAYVSGPQSFIEEQLQVLRAMGVPENCVLTPVPERTALPPPIEVLAGGTGEVYGVLPRTNAAGGHRGGLLSSCLKWSQMMNLLELLRSSNREEWTRDDQIHHNIPFLAAVHETDLVKRCQHARKNKQASGLQLVAVLLAVSSLFIGTKWMMGNTPSASATPPQGPSLDSTTTTLDTNASVDPNELVLHTWAFCKAKRTKVLAFLGDSEEKKRAASREWRERGSFVGLDCGEDSFFVARHHKALGVADGVGGWRSHGVDPSEFSNALMQHAKAYTDKHYPDQHSLDPQAIMQHAHEKVIREGKVQAGSSTACIATLKQLQDGSHALNVANLGDSGLIVVRDGQQVFRAEELTHAFNTPYQLAVVPRRFSRSLSDSASDAARHVVPVQEGDVVVLGTDGLFDNRFASQVAAEAQWVAQSSGASSVPTKDIYSTVPIVGGWLRRVMGTTAVPYTDPYRVAERIVTDAIHNAYSKSSHTPWAAMLREHGVPNAVGGKPDDVTVLLGLVGRRGVNDTNIPRQPRITDNKRSRGPPEREEDSLPPLPLSRCSNRCWCGLFFLTPPIDPYLHWTLLGAVCCYNDMLDNYFQRFLCQRPKAGGARLPGPAGTERMPSHLPLSSPPASAPTAAVASQLMEAEEEDMLLSPLTSPTLKRGRDRHPAEMTAAEVDAQLMAILHSDPSDSVSEPSQEQRRRRRIEPDSQDAEDEELLLLLGAGTAAVGGATPGRAAPRACPPFCRLSPPRPISALPWATHKKEDLRRIAKLFALQLEAEMALDDSLLSAFTPFMRSRFLKKISASSSVGSPTAATVALPHPLDLDPAVLDDDWEDGSNPYRQRVPPFRLFEPAPRSITSELADPPAMDAPLGSQRPPAFSLRPYQLEGVGFLLQHFHRGLSCILADDMGLGKTAQISAFFHVLSHLHGVTGPHLIITPLTTLTNWMRELSRWAPELRLLKYHGGKQERSRLSLERHPGVVVTTPALINQDASFFVKRAFVCVVVDEAHVLKNQRTRITSTSRKLTAAFRVAVTGTPVQNDTREVWSLFGFLFPHITSREQDEVEENTAAAAAACATALGHVMLRRTKGQLLLGIPPRVDHPTTLLEPTFIQSELLSRMVSGAVESGEGSMQGHLTHQRMVCSHPLAVRITVLSSSGSSSAPEEGAVAVASVQKRLEAAGIPFTAEAIIDPSAKMRYLDTELPRLRAAGHRCLVFSNFTSVVDLLEAMCVLRGYSYERLDGSCNRVERELSMHRFNNTASSCFLFLITTSAGGVGITLTGADTVILFDSNFNPQLDRQAADRAHRIGQTREVHVYRLCLQNTVEEHIRDISAFRASLGDMIVSAGGSGAAAATGRQRDSSSAAGPTGAEIRAMFSRLLARQKEAQEEGRGQRSHTAVALEDAARCETADAERLVEELLEISRGEGPAAVRRTAGARRGGRGPGGPAKHTHFCFLCGEKMHAFEPLLHCLVCPKAFHAACVGAPRRQQGVSAPRQWTCPRHHCTICEKPMQADGAIFMCVACPRAFCFDCLPAHFLELDDEGRSLRYVHRTYPEMEAEGMELRRTCYYIRCLRCSGLESPSSTSSDSDTDSEARGRVLSISPLGSFTSLYNTYNRTEQNLKEMIPHEPNDTANRSLVALHDPCSFLLLLSPSHLLQQSGKSASAPLSLFCPALALAFQMLHGILSNFTDNERIINGLEIILVPWLILVAYVAYHYVLRPRPPAASIAVMEPFLYFYTLFTSGASSGYDREVFQLLHPSLLHKVDKGMVRAMMRYLHSTLGKVVDVPLETAVVKQDGLQVNTVALVHFERARFIKCQLHFVLRPSLERGAAQTLSDGTTKFHVMSFHVDVPRDKAVRAAPPCNSGDASRENSSTSPLENKGSSLRRQSSVVDFLELDDFIPVGERFIKGLFLRSQRHEMVELMIPAMREKYEKDASKLEQLTDSMRQTVRAAGGYKCDELDFTLVDARYIYAKEVQEFPTRRDGEEAEPVVVDKPAAECASSPSNTRSRSSRGPDGAIKGFCQIFHVMGNNRDIEVELRLTLVELACRVFNFQVRLLPDERHHVVLDHDSGESERYQLSIERRVDPARELVGRMPVALRTGNLRLMDHAWLGADQFDR